MEEFIGYIIKNLVAEPDAVQVSCLQGEKGMLIELRVAPADIPKIVGRRGVMIKSLRVIALAAAAVRLKRHARLELIE